MFARDRTHKGECDRGVGFNVGHPRRIASTPVQVIAMGQVHESHFTVFIYRQGSLVIVGCKPQGVGALPVKLTPWLTEVREMFRMANKIHHVITLSFRSYARRFMLTLGDFP